MDDLEVLRLLVRHILAEAKRRNARWAHSPPEDRHDDVESVICDLLRSTRTVQKADP